MYSALNKEAKKNGEEKLYSIPWIYENLIKTGHIITEKIHKPLIKVDIPKEPQTKF